MGHFYRVLLLSTFVVLNVLTPIVIAMLVPMYYPKLRIKASNGDFVACLYWATAFIAFVLNVNYIHLTFRFHIINNEPDITTCVIHLSRFPCTIPSNTSVYADEMLTLLAKVIIIPVANIIELFIAIFVVRQFITTRLQYGHVYVVRRVRYDHRYYCWKHYLLQSAHVFGLWNIFISIQLATMTVLPLCVLLLTHPQVTIILLIFLILLIIILILIISYLLYWFQDPTRRCRPKRCVKNTCVSNFDHCNPGTDHFACCLVRGDVDGSSTGWNKRNSSLTTSIPSIVCCWMVFELEEISEERFSGRRE